MDVSVNRSAAETKSSTVAISFARFGGISAMIAGGSSFGYSVSFVIIDRVSPSLADKLTALFLLLGGCVGSAALIALYERLGAEGTDHGFALWALLLGIVSALGSAVHGGYDLANVIHEPATNPDLPSGVDPRGLLTFGVAGLATLTFAWLIRHSHTMPRQLGALGLALGVLLIVIYLGRLVVLNAQNPLIVVPAVLTGFVISPAWYVWLGRELLRETEKGA
ncbi:MAG: hypothetical protein WBW04_09170 [Nitrolancea sp.]